MIGKTNIMGSENPLNFKLVGGASQPTNPTENTIWVNTATAIGYYIFAAAAPTARHGGAALETGDVWISTKTTSPVPFNALKKNALVTYPNGCYQWNGSAWISKAAKTYQNGAWKSWYTYVYNRGVELITGAVTTVGNGYLIKGTEYIRSYSTGGGSISSYVDYTMNFDGISTVYIDYKAITAGARLCIMTGTSGNSIAANITLPSATEAVAGIDVSSITGTNRVRFGWWGDNSVWDCNMYELYY